MLWSADVVVLKENIVLQLLQLVVFAILSLRLVIHLSITWSSVGQWLAPGSIVKHRKPLVSNNMEEDRDQEDADLSLSDGGPPRRVRDSGGLESEGLTLRSRSILRGPTLPTSQISSPQAQAESSVVTTESQAISSLSGHTYAATHAGSVDLSPTLISHSVSSQNVAPRNTSGLCYENYLLSSSKCRTEKYNQRTRDCKSSSETGLTRASCQN